MQTEKSHFTKLFYFLVIFLLSGSCYSQLIAAEYNKQNRLSKITTPTKTIIYEYDKLGNRISQHVFANYCEGSVYGANSNTVNAISYQWQVDSTGNGFVNLNNNFYFLGTNSDSLQIINPPTNYRGYQFKCMVTTSNEIFYTDPYILKPKANWQGSVDSVWSNPANWECNRVPDEFVDVTIPSGRTRYPVVTANVKLYSLAARPGSTIIIKAGFNVEIKGH